MHDATLSVNLAALTANWRLLRDRHAKKHTAAVVKANAYGLGMPDVSRALFAEGCRQFFVATLDEAIELRNVLEVADIAVFNGIFPGEEKEFAHHRLIPVVNDPGQIPQTHEYILHIDTGMTRLGCSMESLALLPQNAPKPKMLMSHLACANDPADPKNEEQLWRLIEARNLFPGVPTSFVNSSGHFLPGEYHFDLGRPGCAIYGINPTNVENPMQHVATLSAPILQIRMLERDETVGYGATYEAKKGAKLAVAGLGYADGYFRSLSNRGFAYVGGYKVPFAGRVSMDSITLDVSMVPDTLLENHQRIEFINEQQQVDEIAKQCDTIGYEVFTRIGRRVKREYT